MKTLLIVIGVLAASVVQAQQKDMSFFITSVGLGKGADLGGLKGADAHCQALAKAAGAGGRVWRAYLSTTGTKPEHARNRIGLGPWKNAKGEEIAKNVEDLHDSSKINKQTGLDEKGQPVNGRGDSPNRHDILTGSQPDGRAMPVDRDTTCSNWTSSSAEGSAVVGHHDRVGPPTPRRRAPGIPRIPRAAAARMRCARAAATACSTASQPSSFSRCPGD